MMGRCPDCGQLVSGNTPMELVGDILGHDMLRHGRSRTPSEENPDAPDAGRQTG